MSFHRLPTTIAPAEQLLSKGLQVLLGALKTGQEQRAQQEAIKHAYEQQCQGVTQANHWMDLQARQRHEDLNAQWHVFDRTMDAIEQEERAQQKNEKALRHLLQSVSQQPQSSETRALLSQGMQGLVAFGEQRVQRVQSLSRMRNGSGFSAHPRHISYYEED